MTTMPAAPPAEARPAPWPAVPRQPHPVSGATRFATLLATHVGALPHPQPGASVTLGEMIQGLAGAAIPAGGLPALALATDVGGSERAVEAATAYLGVPYRWGGDDPATGLDCSGLVQRVFADLGIALPRVSADQARAGAEVGSLADARPGDLVFWAGRQGRPNHIAIYAGGGQMIHAPRTGDVVRLDSLRSAPPDTIRRIS
jgi:cell wall-associated NlpC family hydrolase